MLAQVEIRERSGESCIARNDFCPGWIIDHFDRYTTPLAEHVYLTVVAVALGFAIAFTLALLARRRRWAIGPIVGITGVLYTLPSLAVFFLLLPITGRGTTTALIALTAYTLQIIFRNIITGLDNVPADARDAGRGMGLTDRQLLWRVELPLAVPDIIAGLRIATTTTVGLATLAVFAGAGGLGEQIVTGSNITFKTGVVAAGGLAVLLALVARRDAARGAARDDTVAEGAARMMVDLPLGFLSDFSNAFDFIFNTREAQTGGVQVGGLAEVLEFTWEHLKVSGAAIGVACAVAIPAGLVLGHAGKGELLAISISNIGRAVPSLALIAFFVAYLGVGFTNVTLALVLLAIPPILTNTYVGVRQVDRDVIDAGRGMGLSPQQVVRRIELPLALPSIFGGIRTSAVNVVATATIAPLAGVLTLGDYILSANVYGEDGRLAGAILVAALALSVEAAFALLQRLSVPRGLALSDTSG